MAVKSTGKTTGKKKSTSVKKGTPVKKTVSKKNSRETNKTSEKKSTEKKLPKEELVPDFNNELVLLVTLVISTLLFLSNFRMSGKVGEVINQFTFGMFGIMAYAIPFFLFFGIAFYLANRASNKRYIPKLVASIAFFVVLAAIIQLVFGQTTEMKLWDYYRLSAEKKSGGGLLGGVLCYLCVPAFGKVGSYVVLVALALVCVMILTGKALFALLGEISGREIQKRKEERKIRAQEEKEYQEQCRQEQKGSKAQSFLLEPETEEKKEKQEIPVKNFFGGVSRTSPAGKRAEHSTQGSSDTAPSEVIPIKKLDEETEELLYIGNYHMSQDNVDTVNSIYEEELRKKFDRVKQPKSFEKHEQTKTVFQTPEPRGEEFEPSFSEQSLADRRYQEGASREKTIFEQAPYGISTIKRDAGKETTVAELTKEERKANQASAEDIAKIAEEAGETMEEVRPVYQFPPIGLLNRPERKNNANAEAELRTTAEKLRTTLDSFGVSVSITDYSRGPSVTRYEIQPEQGVKVSRITNLIDDIKLNLAAADIRIEAPIPGKAAVGIEVPNKENTTVTLRELLESQEFEKNPSKLAFTVGRDIGGQCIVADIAKMPHLLIAGATGSGKSVCINTIIMSILYKAHPDEVKLLMVDPKVVELSVYNGIPHLLIPVVTDPKKASAALNWAVAEMEERYNKFYEVNARDLKGYHEKLDALEKNGEMSEQYPHYPQLVIIVDELADLMMVASTDVEDAICRLAQKARAAGIHLVLATQRPSVNVITGLIKANIPSRIAFAVSSGIDSRTILDSVGAEKLLGKGDMLYYPSNYPKPVRVQGAFVSDREVTSVVEFLKGQNGGPAQYSEEISAKITTVRPAENTSGNSGAENGRDEYFAEAGRYIIEREKASIGMLQREYKIGFNRAARIMDQLADAGVVGPEEGTKPRKILMTSDEYEAFLAAGDH